MHHTFIIYVIAILDVKYCIVVRILIKQGNGKSEWKIFAHVFHFTVLNFIHDHSPFAKDWETKTKQNWRRRKVTLTYFQKIKRFIRDS